MALLTYCLVSKAPIAILNVLGAGVVITGVRAPILVIVFSGMANMGWVVQLAPGLLWGFLCMYCIILVPTVKFIYSRTVNFAVSLLNQAGLPPFTGFAWKLKAVRRTHFKIARRLLLGSGLALVAYSRLLLNWGDERTSVSPLVVGTLIVGVV